MNVQGVKAFAHITGGGLTENIVRTLTMGQGIELNLSNWKLPPIFKWLSITGNVDKFEMLKTFNCGIGMTIICSPSSEGEIFSLLEKLGEKPIVIGKVTSGSKVEYTGTFA
jgi:phosphoribosylformylglycinamidine cyclo-ligase